MRLQAKDINSRILITRFLEKIDEIPEAGRKIGVEDSSHFRMKADTKVDRKPTNNKSSNI